GASGDHREVASRTLRGRLRTAERGFAKPRARAPTRAGPTRLAQRRSRSRTKMALSPELARILVCPACNDDLTYEHAARSLTCPRCRLRYKVVDDIPDMIIDEAEKF